MIKIILSFFIFLAFSDFAFPQFNNGKFSEQLGGMVSLYDNSEKVRVIIHLYDQFSIDDFMAKAEADGLDKNTRTKLLLDGLKEKANSTQKPLLDFLNFNASLNRASDIKNFWIINAVSVYAEIGVIKMLSQRSDVGIIEVDNPILFDEENSETLIDNAVTGVENGIKAIKADILWRLGFTGQGTIVMNVDSGVDGYHPALNYKWNGNFVPWSHAWFDAAGTSFPTYCTDHGTHTMGIMCGLGISTGDTVGVSFNSRWIAARRSCSGNYTTFGIAAFQWGMDPDSNSSTRDEASVINCSWNSTDPTNNECNGTFKNTLITLEAAGVPVVWSSGNSGPGASTVTSPKNINTNIVNAFTVGAVNGNIPTFPIAGFSSRGPSICGGAGSLLIKPEVSAPGVSVRSCVISPNYGLKDGTSMAAPHASGSVALLRSFAPNITGKMALLALYYSADDLGTVGEDNTYGMGMVNVFKAMVLLGLNIAHTPINDTLNTAGPYKVRIALNNSSVVNAKPKPSSIKLFWSRNSSLINDSITMTLDTGNVYYANIPGNGSPANYKYFIRAYDTLDVRAQLPGDAPFTYFSFNAGSVSIGSTSEEIPKQFELSQNYPNPFNPVTNIAFAMPLEGNVSLKVYDITGKEVMTLINEFRPAGYYSVSLDASSLASGVYFYKLISDNSSNVLIKKMIVIK